MRILLLLLLVLFVESISNKSSVMIDPERNISTVITKVATKYDLDRTYLSCLLKVESQYKLNTISKTHDHGIGQINRHTAISFGFNVEMLTSNLYYSVERAGYMLAYYKWLKKKDEPRTWVCRYNVGPGPLTKRNRGYNCELYLDKFNKCITSDLKGVL